MSPGRYNISADMPWLTFLECSGNETTLALCEHSAWGKQGCGHSQYLAVQCNYSDTGAYPLLYRQYIPTIRFLAFSKNNSRYIYDISHPTCGIDIIWSRVAVGYDVNVAGNNCQSSNIVRRVSR